MHEVEGLTAVVVRHRAWFRPSVDLDGLPPLSTDLVNRLSVQLDGTVRAWVLIGAGPVDCELSPDLSFYFENGPQDYPVFGCPSEGPSSAVTKVDKRTRRVTVAANEALSVVVVSVAVPLALSRWTAYVEDRAGLGDDAKAIGRLVAGAREALDQIVGLYALYQYAVVWEPLEIDQGVFFVDARAHTAVEWTTRPMDNMVPIRLRVGPKLEGGCLDDGALSQLSALSDKTLLWPLILFQRALWQRDVRLRFLDTFLMLDCLVGEASPIDSERERRESLYEFLEKATATSRQDDIARVRAMKGLLLQAPLAERLGAYLRELNVCCEFPVLRGLLRLRNDLAHGRPVDDEVLRTREFEARLLARAVLRGELARRGIDLGAPPASDRERAIRSGPSPEELTWSTGSFECEKRQTLGQS
jgi:hypothetical protein